MKRINRNILSIIFSNRDLCTRCGTCVGACPTKAISLDEEFYPKLETELCTECEICSRTCPGGKINFADLTEITFGHRNDADTFDGHVQKIFVDLAPKRLHLVRNLSRNR